MALGLITTPFKGENVRLPKPETAAPQKSLPQATTDLPSTVSVLAVALNKRVRDCGPNLNLCGTHQKRHSKWTMRARSTSRKQPSGSQQGITEKPVQGSHGGEDTGFKHWLGGQISGRL